MAQPLKTFIGSVFHLNRNVFGYLHGTYFAVLLKCCGMGYFGKVSPCVAISLSLRIKITWSSDYPPTYP